MTITTIRSRRRLTAVLLSGLLAYLLPALGAGLGAPAYGDDPACAAAGANQTTTRRVLLEFGGSRDGTTDGAAYLDSETDPCTEAGGNDISFDAYPSVAVHISCSEDLVGLEFPGLGTVTEFWVDSVNNGGNTPGSCQTDIPTPPVVGEDRPDVRIEKLNDADEDAVFSDDEVADEVGRAVTFEATVTNTGDLAGVVVLVDEYPAGEPSPTVLEVFPGSGATAATCTGPGGAFAGADLLAPGATVTCTFTIDGYTPASGAALTNTLTVELRDETGTPIAGDDDASTVRTIVPETPAAPPTLVLDPCLVLADGTGGLDSTGTATNSDLVAVEVTFADTTVVSVNGVATGDDVTTVTLQPGANTLVFDNSTVGDVVGMSLGDALVAEATVTDCDASVLD